MKSKTVAALLAFFLGGLGAHKFYLGQTGKGILYLVFVWTWIPAFLGLIEGISYLTMSRYEFNEKFNKMDSNLSSSSKIEIPFDEKEIGTSISSTESFETTKPTQSSSLAEARKKMASAVKSKTN